MKVELFVIDKIEHRQKKGLVKYGVTVEDSQLSREEWLIHLQEELLDGAIYIEKLLTYWKCTLCGTTNTKENDRCHSCSVLHLKPKE